MSRRHVNHRKQHWACGSIPCGLCQQRAAKSLGRRRVARRDRERRELLAQLSQQGAAREWSRRTLRWFVNLHPEVVRRFLVPPSLELAS